MKVSQIVLGGFLLACAGCAQGRPYSPGAPSGAGNSPVIPDTTPSLGEPEPSGGTGSSSFFRGTGPTLKMPEAFRDDPALRSPRLSSRWQSTSPQSRTNGYRPSASAAPVSTADPAALADEPTWSRFYRSTDRRVIETIQLGNGAERIAILGSLHGDETQSIALTEELARYLKTHPESLKKVTVLIVKTPNPDGHAARSPYNVHGVDLNRNFPASNWTALQNSRAGGKAASEAETRVVMRLLSEFRPTLLVHLKDSRDGGIINSEGNVRDRAEDLAQLINGQALQGLGAKTSGSMESYALTQLKCPSLTLLLPTEASDQAAWARNRDALLSLIGEKPAASPQTTAVDEQTHPFDRPSVKKSSLQQSPTRQPAGTRDVANTRRPDRRDQLPAFPNSIPDHGYVELPAP